MKADPFNHKKIWSHVKRYELKSFDFGMRKLVRDLNENGQHTINSCRGHLDNLEAFTTTEGRVRVGGRGYVIMDARSYNAQTTLSILRKRGLKNIKKYFIGTDHSVIAYLFDPIFG